MAFVLRLRAVALVFERRVKTTVWCNTKLQNCEKFRSVIVVLRCWTSITDAFNAVGTFRLSDNKTVFKQVMKLGFNQNST